MKTGCDFQNCKGPMWSCYRMVVGCTTTCEISAFKVVSSNSAHGEAYTLQHYVLKFVSHVRQVGGFLQVRLFRPPITLTATITEILFKMAFSTITLTSTTPTP